MYVVCGQRERELKLKDLLQNINNGCLCEVWLQGSWVIFSSSELVFFYNKHVLLVQKKKMFKKRKSIQALLALH